MADYAEWCEIIARCMGFEDDEFIKAYEENISNQNDEVIESSPIAEVLILFAREMDTDYWQGTPTLLYKKLTDIADQIKPELKRSSLWPKASNTLTSRINEVEPNLKEKGIEVITGERDRLGNRVIKINNLQKKEKETPSKEIPLSEEKEECNINKDEKLFNPSIQRLGYSDTWECERCPQTGDIHYMKQHICT